MRSILLVGLVWILLGCSTANKATSSDHFSNAFVFADREKQRTPAEKWEMHCQSRVGTNINDLISRVGPPTSTFNKTNGETVYSFDRVEGVNSAAVGVSGASFGSAWQRKCRVNYTASADTIQSYTWDGECY
jgi:hypothetical protein